MSSVPRSNLAKHAEHVLGYLNFSAGNEEPKLFIALDALFAAAAEYPSPWQEVFRQLLESLQELQRDNPAFVDVRQAETVVRRTRDEVLPGYREFHRDLLFHLDDVRMFNSFFVGRVFQVVLQMSPEREDLAEAAVRALNDFIGHRP
ncbi:MAG: hypothetical protein KDB14_32250, partial [Planctomycetales bacterium]|nr:hypothetical protein [Planctomycetales bacterium]